jgi:hypothetical protein
MADSKPINWAYPFKSKATAEGETSPGSVTAESYYDALAKAKDGFYPMGANGLWHGGIHFDDGTAGSLDQSAIHCIADGEVIAYRIDQRYPTTQYGEGPTVVHLPFSTGFVLVKHRLELPPVPGAPAAEAGETEEAAPAATASSALTFYSLYMHLADWASYSNADAPTPPAFFGETLYSVKADKATDGVLGLRVRAAARDGAVTALLPKGTKVKVGDPDAGSPAWRKLLSILEGSAIPALTGAELGWIYTGEMQAVTGEADTFLVADKANDAESTLAPQTGLNVRKTGNGKSSDPKTGLLPVGAKCSLKAGTAAYRQLQQIVEGQDIAPLSANSVHNIQGFVHFASLQASQAVPTLDTVHLLPQPYPIKAGELVGHLGKYQNFDDARPRSMLHLEVFTSEDVPAFITQSRAVGEKLPDEQKTLIKVDKGSKIIQPAAADGQIETGADVRICSDSPKAGRWAKVQKYAICNADKNTELGRYNNTDSSYPLSTTQKATLAARMGIDVADMPDQVDFLRVYFNSVEGSDAHDYDTGTIPTTHPWRKVGAAVGEPVWVERSNLNAQGQRTSTAGALAAWSAFPVHTLIEGQPCGYARILPAASWDGLPDERKAIDPDKVHWWYVTVGDENGNDISGWAAEKDLIVSRHSPWEWPGFSTIQDKLPLDAHLARTLDATGRATEEETQSYAALIEEAERGEILSGLYDVIDLPDEKGTRDKKLTPAELKAALGKPWLAQQLSLLISQHESEWFWNEGKWNQLDKLMDHTPADPNPNWVAEKGRIKALSWWKELAGQPGIAADGVAWHFQPAGLISNLLSVEIYPVIYIDGGRTELRFLSFFDGSEIDENDYVIAANELGCEIAAIKAVAITETGSVGSYFIKEGDDVVPSILFERHYFHALTGGAHDASHPDISNPSRGGYGRFSAQYKKLVKAYHLDSSAALKSASWGKFQIMGRYHLNAGYASVEEFVNDLSISEKNHLKAFVNFIKADARLAKAIVDKDWLAFAKAYNGPAQEGYDKKMKAHYNAFNSD